MILYVDSETKFEVNSAFLFRIFFQFQKTL